MLLSTRVLTGIVFLVCGLASAGSLSTLLLRVAGRDIETKPSREPPSQKVMVILQRLKAKDLLASELIAGKRGLFEVAAWFRVLNAAPAEYPDDYWRNQPGRSDGEKICRQVIAWAVTHMQATLPASQVEMFECQMEEELRQHIACHGEVILPD